MACYGIVINGGSFVSDGRPHTLSIGSYGNDPVGASCGGVVGDPGRAQPCSELFRPAMVVASIYLISVS